MLLVLVTKDPRKTTGLIGRTYKNRNVLSEAVLTVEGLVMSTLVREQSRIKVGYYDNKLINRVRDTNGALFLREERNG